jgi:D-alanine-D-alanine ligase
VTTNFGKVAILMGGSSAEREISIESGSAVYESLSRQGVDAHIFDPRDQSLCELVEEEFNRAFIALHGRGGEDGTVQGALQSLGIPYTGSGVLGSAIAMDKVRTKLIWKSSGLLTPDYFERSNESDLEILPSNLEFPLIIKPISEGSSLGVTKVNNRDELLPAWNKALAMDDRVFAEKWIDGKEYTATILGNKVLPLIQLETPREFYDFEAKYTENTTQYICPVDLDKGMEEALAKIVFSAFSALDGKGWGRIDFIADDQGKAWLIELNTVPGLTSHSLVPMSAKEAGISFDELVITILKTSVV